MRHFARRPGSGAGLSAEVAPVQHAGLLRPKMRAGKAAPFAAPRSVQQVLATPGQALNRATRESMESRFGQDFTKVRVHSDPAAQRSARELRAHAYTVGKDIVFAPGRYSAGSSDGQRLIAHELAHVVQQGRAGSAEAGAPAMEDAAQQAADSVSQGSSVAVTGAAMPGIARQDDGTGHLPADPAGKYAHPVIYPTMAEYAVSEAVDGVADEDGRVHAVIYRSYPPASLVRAKPVQPAAGSAPKRTRVAKKPDPPVSAAELRDIAEALQPKLIYPKAVRQLRGAAQFVGGSLEAGLGGVGGLATAETGVGAAAGTFLLLHGADTATSGFHTMVTGESSPTYTFQIGAGLARDAGADPRMAQAVGESAEIFANAAAAGVDLIDVPTSTKLADPAELAGEEPQLWLNHQLKQGVVATPRTRGFDRFLTKDLQKGADAFGPVGKVDAVHKADRPFGVTKTGELDYARAGDSRLNRSLGATRDKLAVKAARDAGQFAREGGVDLTVPKGTRSVRPAKEAWRLELRAWKGAVSKEDALRPFTDPGPYTLAPGAAPAETPGGLSTGEQLELPSGPGARDSSSAGSGMAPRLRIEGSDLGLRIAGPEPRFRIAEPIDETDGASLSPGEEGHTDERALGARRRAEPR